MNDEPKQIARQQNRQAMTRASPMKDGGSQATRVVECWEDIATLCTIAKLDNGLELTIGYGEKIPRAIYDGHGDYDRDPIRRLNYHLGFGDKWRGDHTREAK